MNSAVKKPVVYMMLGLPGSGKTTKSKKIAEAEGLERFSLDEEYFARVGNEQQEHRDFEIEREVGEEIKNKVASKLLLGESMVLDFCPWRKKERDGYLLWLRQHGGEPRIYYFNVPIQQLIRRLQARNKENSADYQYMTPEMLEDFNKRFDPPLPGEATVIN
jgi:predicted kinase